MQENSKTGRRRLPLSPYGADLAARLRYGNLPCWVFILTGRNAWERAKALQFCTKKDAALVWDGGEYHWPVEGCACLIEADVGPSLAQLRGLAGELLAAGADCVLLWSVHWRLALPTIYRCDGTAEVLDADDVNQVLRPEEVRRVA